MLVAELGTDPEEILPVEKGRKVEDKGPTFAYATLMRGRELR